MSAQPDVHPRLHESVDLTHPLHELESAVFRWASQLGHGAVYSLTQLDKLRRQLDQASSLIFHCKELAMDVQVAHGAILARMRQPEGGWLAYLAGWEAKVLGTTMGMSTQLEQLRMLQDEFGGVLINGRSLPFMLLIPLEDGTWLKMGWTTITHLSRSPIDGGPFPTVLAGRSA